MTKNLTGLLELETSLMQSINPERKAKIDQIALSIFDQSPSGANVLFVCVHNSRRSHMAQIWFALALREFKLNEFKSYSAGTEVTSFNPNAVEAFRSLGFTLKIDGGSNENPLYDVSIKNETSFVSAYSKIFNNEKIPKNNTYAVMVCSEAEENCPYIVWAKDKFLLSFNDPKDSDGSPERKAVYHERCIEIGREVCYLASQIKSLKS